MIENDTKYHLIPFEGLLKISESMKKEIPFEKWYKIFSNIETLIWIRESVYKNGERLVRLTTKELLTLERKYEKEISII